MGLRFFPMIAKLQLQWGKIRHWLGLFYCAILEKCKRDNYGELVYEYLAAVQRLLLDAKTAELLA